MAAVISDGPARRAALQLARFVVSGGVATAVYFATMTLLLQTGTRPLACGVIAYLAAMPGSVTLHKVFTFASHAPSTREVSRFVIRSMVGIVLASGLPELLLTRTALDRLAVIAITRLTVPGISFLTSRAWVFGGQAPP